MDVWVQEQVRGESEAREVTGCMGNVVGWVLERRVFKWSGKCGRWMFGYRNR